jgi:hypothetical protein
MIDDGSVFARARYVYERAERYRTLRYGKPVRIAPVADAPVFELASQEDLRMLADAMRLRDERKSA